MADRQRQTKRVQFRGINTRLVADAMPDGKFPMAFNIRADGDAAVQTRPGYALSFGTGQFVTDMKAYARLGTDSQPRLLVHSRTGGITLDNGTPQSSVGTGGVGASMVPFRPAASPQSWMYISNGTGNMKYSAPDSGNIVVHAKTGIAEPQVMPEVSMDGFRFTEFVTVDGPTVPGGTPGAGANNTWTWFGTAQHASPPLPPGVPIVQNVTRLAGDAIRDVFQDPAWVGPPGGNPEFFVGTGAFPYQVGETLTFPTIAGNVVVEDVYPPISSPNLIIKSIYYFSGNTGHCVIVPSQLAAGGLVNPEDKTAGSTSTQLQPQVQLAALRRGSILNFGPSGTNEDVLVLSVTVGPQMQLAIETSTIFNHAANESIIGIPSIRVAGINTGVTGSITAGQINFVVDKGVGGIETSNFFVGPGNPTGPPNPFNVVLGGVGVPAEDDLIHISISVVQPEQVTELKLIFDIGDGSAGTTFTENFLYFPISASVLEQAVQNQVTQSVVQSQLANPSAIYQALINAGYSSITAMTTLQQIETGTLELNYDPTTGKASVQNVHGQTITLNVPLMTGVGQYTELVFPIRSLTRIGSDQTKSLANLQKVRISCNVTATTTFGIGSLWVGGAYQLDSGTNSSPYYYRTVPRSSLTGAQGNPSPATRYGITPRLQPGIVTLPSVAYDPQIDTVDIYRYGGAILSWRYVGSVAATASVYLDNVLDSAASAGSEIEFDNFEPWPSVDQPWTASVGVSGISGITVTGTVIVVTGPTFPATITRWLPGTLVTLNGNWTYTLWARPTAVIFNGLAGYQFRILENASAPSVTRLDVNEPIVANQMTPYSWGPDANGILFGAGDPLKPGTFYSSKPNNPDASPNNAYDLTPPSEPLLGGQIVDGLSLVASSNRWWQLQAALGTPQRWTPVETPAGRGLAAPFAHCTDGKLIYFVAKDGVYAMAPGSVANNLSDADIGNLFPHEGVPGINIRYGGVTVAAPSYKFAAWFRLSVINALLRFHYYDSQGFLNILVLDMSLDSGGQPRMAWSVDAPHDPLTVSYQPEQPSGTLQSATALYNACYYGDSSGLVWIETDLHNDNVTPIEGVLSTPASSGGDVRVSKQWLDVWSDLLPVSAAVSVHGVVDGSLAGMAQTIASSPARTQVLSTLNGLKAPALGVQFAWLDDFSQPQQTSWTKIYEWSLEFVPQPLLIKTWSSVPTGFGNLGIDGYFHIPRIRMAYMTADGNPVTLSLTFFDGNSPQTLSLPGTSGFYQKTEFVLTSNKGLLVTFSGTHPTGWAPIESDCEVLVGPWARTGPYLMSHTLGGAENP